MQPFFSIVDKPSFQMKSRLVRVTATTIEQEETERECEPFFVCLRKLPQTEVCHLRDVGLLPGRLRTRVTIATTALRASVASTMPSKNQGDEDDVLIELDNSMTHPIDISGGNAHELRDELILLSEDPKTDSSLNVREKESALDLDKSHKDDEALFDVCLLRVKHGRYLEQVWDLDRYSGRPQLRSSFLSLDASRPWILYWCLHGCDLLNYYSSYGENPCTIPSFSKGEHNNNNNQEEYHKGESHIWTPDLETLQSQQQPQQPQQPSPQQTPQQQQKSQQESQQSLLYSSGFPKSSESRQAIVRTLLQCFTTTTVEIPVDLVQRDAYLLLLSHQSLAEPAIGQSSEKSGDAQNCCKFTMAGGFGGGIGQMAHAATTYAAVNALVILAPIEPSALKLLRQIKPLLYPWLVSLLLPQQDGSMRMHHDGEIDVRASYCILAVASLLGYFSFPSSTTTSKTDDNITSTSGGVSLLLDPSVVRYISSCQTFEGGFGSEPFAEAHGGFTFCAVAAIQIWLMHTMPTMPTMPTMTMYNNNTNNNNKNCSENPHQFALNAIDVSSLSAWLARRQMSFEGGFSGRSNKLVDGCYSFWQGAATAIVSAWEHQSLLLLHQRQPQQLQNHNNNFKLLMDPWMTVSPQKVTTNESNSYGKIDLHGEYLHHPQQENIIDKKSFVDTERSSSNNCNSAGTCHSIPRSTTAVATSATTPTTPTTPTLLFDTGMLQRYILLCAQDVNGGLRDKPSKGRDFYHTCYNLSGLSISQHYYYHRIDDKHSNIGHDLDNTTLSSGTDERRARAVACIKKNIGHSSDDNHNVNGIVFGHDTLSQVAQTHPCYNIRIEKVQFILQQKL